MRTGVAAAAILAGNYIALAGAPTNQLWLLTAPRLPAARSFFTLAAVIVPAMQPEHFERPLEDDPICHILVTHGFLSEK